MKYQLVESPSKLARDRPDAHWQAINARGELVGHCSLWWQQTPTLAGDRLGYLGHWAATGDAAPGLLERACDRLAEQGCQRAIAPIDGSTWNAYRAVLAPVPGWPFFSEPACPPAAPFLQAGFQLCATYQSSLCTDLRPTDPRLEPVAARLAAQGVAWRSLAPNDFSDAAFASLLARLHPLIQHSFRRSLLFSPLSARDFAARYQPLRPYLRPELCWLAEESDRLLGFLLAFPDYQAPADAPATLVVKTLAVRPERRYAGLGAVLLEAAQQGALRHGYRQAIHALMQVANPSRCLSDRYAQPWRSYGLLAKSL